MWSLFAADAATICAIQIGAVCYSVFVFCLMLLIVFWFFCCMSCVLLIALLIGMSACLGCCHRAVSHKVCYCQSLNWTDAVPVLSYAQCLTAIVWNGITSNLQVLNFFDSRTYRLTDCCMIVPFGFIWYWPPNFSYLFILLYLFIWL